jgi:hypothetical protein
MQRVCRGLVCPRSADAHASGGGGSGAPQEEGQLARCDAFRAPVKSGTTAASDDTVAHGSRRRPMAMRNSDCPSPWRARKHRRSDREKHMRTAQRRRCAQRNALENDGGSAIIAKNE